MTVLLEDIMPCEITVGDQLHRRCRVFIFDDGVVAYSERAGSAQQVFAARHSAQPELPPKFTPRTKWRAVLHTVEGDVYVNRSPGCGCHSPLLQLRPEDVIS